MRCVGWGGEGGLFSLAVEVFGVVVFSLAVEVLVDVMFIFSLPVALLRL